MPDDRTQRQLSAILAADIAGYSKLMGADEEGTLTRLRALRRDMIEPKIAEHRGRLVKTTGDGFLATFVSVVDALRFAIEMQTAVAKRQAALSADQRLIYRIGITLGDILVEDGDIYGDDVNIAARIEAVAEPGTIYLSEDAQRQVLGKLSVTLEDRGEQRLKNIARPVRVYRVRPHTSSGVALTLPDKPSIAVLPFQNMSGDPEQDYFADGIVEEITSAISRFRGLFVISRSSSFTYKGRSVDVRQIGRELGVRYVLEGSVRKAGNRIRIAGQLIDATNDAHIWADRFDAALEDVFDLQDQVAATVAAAIAPKVEQAEIERSKLKPTESLDAYDIYLRGLSAVHRWTEEANNEAMGYFLRATELDPGFASAYGMAARAYSQRKFGGWIEDHEHDAAHCRTLARQAAVLGKDDALALCTAGIGLTYVSGEVAEGRLLVERALTLNPNLAWAWLFGGWMFVWAGENDRAVEYLAKAMRLSPNDPQFFNMQFATAAAHYSAGRFDEALSWVEAGAAAKPDLTFALWAVIACAGQCGRADLAEQACRRLRAADPALRIDRFQQSFAGSGKQGFGLWVEGLRKAGLAV